MLELTLRASVVVTGGTWVVCCCLTRVKVFVVLQQKQLYKHACESTLIAVISVGLRVVLMLECSAADKGMLILPALIVILSCNIQKPQIAIVMIELHYICSSIMLYRATQTGHYY